MKRKRSNTATQPAKKAKPQLVVAPQKSLRYQPNTLHGLTAELKEITNAAAAKTPTAANSRAFVALAASAVLNAVVQGTSAITRIGRKIRMRSLDLRWIADMTGGTGGSVMRLLVVYDKQANIALPATLQIVDTDDFLSPMNLSNSDRFTVLRSLITEPMDSNGSLVVSGHEYIKMDLETVYNATNGGTIADIQTGSVLLMVAGSGTSVTLPPTLTFISRIRFDDH